MPANEAMGDQETKLWIYSRTAQDGKRKSSLSKTRELDVQRCTAEGD